MKSYKNLFIAFIILFGSFALVLAEEEDDNGFGELICEMIAFIIGDMLGSCLTNPDCGALLGPIILYIGLFAIVLCIIINCCCGRDFDDDYDYRRSRRYNRRAAMFGAGMGWGATKSYFK